MFTISVASTLPCSCCPLCAQASSSVHSHMLAASLICVAYRGSESFRCIFSANRHSDPHSKSITYPTMKARCISSHFHQAGSWEEMQQIHRKWVQDYHSQRDFAQEQLDDGCHSPAQVIGWHQGTMVPERALHKPE